MSQPDPSVDAIKLPNGARFWRCALQVNPAHYLTTYRGQEHGLDEAEYAERLIGKCRELDIRVVAVADHNNTAAVDVIRAAAAAKGICVFPGFEVSSSDGVHVLGLYPPETDAATLSRYLGEFGIRRVDPSTELANKPLSDVLRCVRDQGGVAIAAHITNDKGLLNALHGQARASAWKDANLLAVQIPGTIHDLPQDKRPIVLNQNPEYRRVPGAGKKLAVAVVNAKDVAQPDDLEDASATCWIKMSEISVEGLKQAFLDPDSRIRLNSDPMPEEHAKLLAMSWQGGFLDEAAIHFNENLNILIGGRGTGKSTVIESLRYVLDLEPIGDDATKAHDGIVRQVLRSGTKMSLRVHSHLGSRRDYLIERTVPNPPVVKDESGKVLPLSPRDVLPGMEVYGQHEISELTRRPDKLTRLLERFVERDENVAQRKADLKRELEQSRRRLLDIAKEEQQIQDRLAALPALEETLKSYQDAGLEQRLKEKSLLIREERVLKTATDRVAPFADIQQQLAQVLPIDRAFLAPKAIQELPGREILSKADAVLDEFSQGLEAASAQIAAVIAKAESGLSAVRAEWHERQKEVESAYEKILRELQKAKVDGEEFVRLRRQIEDLRPLREKQAVMERDRKENEDHRRNLLDEWEDMKSSDFRQLQRAATRVSQKLTNQVRVRVDFGGNREPLFELLRDQVGGRLAEAIEALKNLDKLSLVELALACRAGKDELAEKFGLPPGQADHLCQAKPDTIMQVEELDLPSTTVIELNVAADGQEPHWQALDGLSTGQKATAVLLLLLLESEAPLIVDQPEDDLDNRFITEGVVPKMREEKRRRQFVFATHNANMPVLGDAELIVGLTAAGEAGQGQATLSPEHMGAIDTGPVREMVEEVLEGGKAAFELRRLKYGF